MGERHVHGGTSARDLAGPRERPAAEEGPWREEPAGTGRATLVLIVEDDPSVASMAARVVRIAFPASERPAVALAASPEEALSALAAADPSKVAVVISDFNLGASMNGLELLACIGARGVPPTRRVLMSGYPRSHFAHDLTPSGIEGFLAKPWAIEDLVVLLRALVTGAPPKSS
jgi:DNA-binding NarL/FixJ family response regulator